MSYLSYKLASRKCDVVIGQLQGVNIITIGWHVPEAINVIKFHNNQEECVN